MNSHVHVCRSTRFFQSAAMAILLAGSAAAVPLRPYDFTSLGEFPSSGFAIDTNTLSFAGMPGGVLVAQSGGAPDIAVFTFDGGGLLASGESITVTGDNALAILFQGAATLAGTIDVSGGDGLDQAPGVTGIGGLGVAGGGRGGNGGPFSSGQNGIGPGHGVVGSNSGSVSGAGSGAGAGFGTPGGEGGAAVTFRAGGDAYGNPLRHELHAGSGGGGGGGVGSGSQRWGGGGGAGGGAIEIGAASSLQLMGAAIIANGGNGGSGFTDGGGGSGGAILLHAFEVELDLETLLQSNGGNSDPAPGSGGCGGAGRIEILHHPAGGVANLGTVEALGGTINASCTDGELVVTPTTSVGVPEPSSVWLAAVLLSLAVVLQRCRCRPIESEHNFDCRQS